jgi:hypothetical protein
MLCVVLFICNMHAALQVGTKEQSQTARHVSQYVTVASQRSRKRYPASCLSGYV